MNGQGILANVRYFLESHGKNKNCAITYDSDTVVRVGINDVLTLPALKELAEMVDDPGMMIDGPDETGFLYQLWIDK